MIPMLVFRLCAADRRKAWVLRQMGQSEDVVDDLVEVGGMCWGVRRVVELEGGCADLAWMMGDSALNVCFQMVGRMVREARGISHE